MTTMMQQIAAPKTDIATGLPSRDIAAEPSKGNEFSVVMRDSNQSAFEQARERAALISDQQNESPYRQPVVENEKPNVDAGNTGTQVEDAVSAQPSNTESNDVENAESSAKAEAQSSGTEKSKEEVKSQDVIKPIDKESAKESDKENNNSDRLSFNYVDYVTQVKNINTDVAKQLESDNTSVSPLLNREQNEELASGMFAVEDIQNMQLSENLSSINIVDEKSESLQATDESVDKILTQIMTDVDRELIGVEGQKLVADQLKSQSLEGLASLNETLIGTDGEVTKINEALETTALGNKLDNLLGANNAEKSLNTDAETNDVDIATAVAARQESIGLSDAVDGKQLESQEITNHLDRTLLDKSKSTTASSETKKADTNPLATIATLSEQAETDSLKNLAQRVSQVISEVAPDTPKGNEFIAALKAGVKEFKAQLAEGREPGIDLKALVTNATEKAEVAINPQQVTRLEQSIQQFSNTLNLAVNGQQQPQQVNFSPSEAVVAEKISQTMNETSKASTQQTSNSAMDKAINIMKPDGQQQMAERVRWMINSRTSAAEIRLDPPELGAMQVRINMSGEAAAVSFVVQSQQAKDALDMAAPRLKELFGEQGIELGQSSVEQDSRGQSGDSSENENLGGSAQPLRNTASAEEAIDVNTQTITQRIAGTSIGGIDYYA